jgi:RNA polymerase primary sigma factor
MLELTDTFAAALDQAAAEARACGALTADAQERLLALAGFDATRFGELLRALVAVGVSVEPLEEVESGDVDEVEAVRAPARDVAPADIDVLAQYLRELRRYPPLTAEEERAMARRARAGDAEGRKRLVLGNLRLVVFLARRYRGRGSSYLDVIGDGNVGLMTAVDRFDPERGFRFSTYASWWIRQAILRGIAEQSAAVRLPVTVLQQMRRFVLEERRLRQTFGGDPAPTEVGAALGLAPFQSERLAGLVRNVRSLDELPGGELPHAWRRGVGEDLTLSVEEMVERQMESERIERVLGRLSPREETILRIRYGFVDGVAHTLQQTGERFGITRERVRQIEQRALRKLREWLEEGDGADGVATRARGDAAAPGGGA